MRPLVGVAPDILEPRPGSLRVSVGVAYLEAIEQVGGQPMVLHPAGLESAASDAYGRIRQQLARCQALVLTGGDDPRTERYGVPTHAAATLVHPLRQALDEALVAAALERPDLPLLAICLGAQMLALAAGGRLCQHLPERPEPTGEHQGVVHPIRVIKNHPVLAAANVYSTHHQAVATPGRLRPIAWAPDGVIEALDDPSARFRLAVQWHPERTEDPAGGRRLFEALLDQAARTTSG